MYALGAALISVWVLVREVRGWQARKDPVIQSLQTWRARDAWDDTLQLRRRMRLRRHKRQTLV